MNILADYHQTDLFYSLQLLFEKRLGHNLYRPIGMDWWHEGYWKLNELEPTAKQYLEMGSQPTDGTLPLNTSGGSCPPPLRVWDSHNQAYQKVITLEEFMENKINNLPGVPLNFDVIIASIPQHIEPFKKLAAMKGCKFVFQAGNVFPEVDYQSLPNLMTNTIPQYPSNHTIQYHQEISLDIFNPSGANPQKKITSFINVYSKNAGIQNYYSLKGLMPDFEFKSYGGQCENGSLGTTEDIAREMKENMFTFMVKWGADGFGHILHDSFAVGTPVIINYDEYKNKIGGKLLIPDETCIVTKIGDTMEEIASVIQNLSPSKYNWMRQRTHERFKEVVNFDEEEIKIRKFIDTLI